MSFELTDIEGPKSVQFGTVLCRWFTAMDFEGKPKTGPVIIKKKKLCLFMMKWKCLTNAFPQRQ
jgi:hypothetical protein